jgi:hypothetical protein
MPASSRLRSPRCSSGGVSDVVRRYSACYRIPFERHVEHRGAARSRSRPHAVHADDSVRKVRLKGRKDCVWPADASEPADITIVDTANPSSSMLAARASAGSRRCGTRRNDAASVFLWALGEGAEPRFEASRRRLQSSRLFEAFRTPQSGRKGRCIADSRVWRSEHASLLVADTRCSQPSPPASGSHPRAGARPAGPVCIRGLSLANRFRLVDVLDTVDVDSAQSR